MSKTTKIIAALGVVAGLGVAALPAFSYATESVSGDAEIYVEVLPAISMTITGNNDDGDHEPITSYKYTIVTPQEGDSPSTQGWYEKSGSTYSLSEDATVVEGKTYFARSANTEGVDVFSPTVGNGIVDGHTEAFKVGPSSSWAQMLPNAVLNGSDDNGFKSTIMVYTNATGGYNLNIKDADSTTALTNIDDGASGTIPAGTIVDPATTFNLTAGTAAWGYVVDTASADGTGYKAISATDALIKQQSAPTSAEANRKTTVYYGVATASDQPTGTYKDVITYTATTR